MGEKKSVICETILFLCIGGMLFFFVQDILTPNWNNTEAMERTEYTISGIDTLEVSDLDVLFLGSSHIRFGISPLELYENYGILSYSLPTSVQPIAGSYWLLEKAYQTHHIKTVVLDVSTLFQESTNASWRYILDNLNFGKIKLEMAKAYTEQSWSDGFLSAIFPIIKYHSDWANITRENFCKSKGSTMYSFGQLLTSISVQPGVTLDLINEEAQNLSMHHAGKKTEIYNNIVRETDVFLPQYEPSINEENLKYFIKIKELCDRNASNLVLIKIPVMQRPQIYNGAWTSIKSQIITAYADSWKIPFIDMVYNDDFKIAAETDFWDDGMHLNSVGAERVSKYLGKYLIEHQLAECRENVVYEASLKKYEKVYTVAKLQTISDFQEYIEELIQQKEYWSVIIVAADEYTLGMNEEDYMLLDRLGFKMIANGKFRDSYVGVLDKKEVIYEALSDGTIEYTVQLANADVNLCSRNGWISIPGASVKMNGQEYSLSEVGLNIVVYDGETGCVIDSVSFNTNDLSQYCVRDISRSRQLLNSYESILCFDGW